MTDSLTMKIAKKMVAARDRRAQPKLSASHFGHYSNYLAGFQAGGAKWRGGLTGDGAGIGLDHRRLRQNSRKAYQETLVARSIVDRYAETVADIGLKFESSPNPDILGISQEQAEDWGKAVDQRFDLWAQSKTSHRAENMNFYQSHRLYATGQQRDGENFVRFYYSSSPELLNPLQFEFVDPEQLVGDAFTTSHAAIQTKDGIVRDASGKEIGYNVRVRKNNKIESVFVPAKGRGSGRTMMIHGFCPEYAGQGRGYSRIGHALQELQNLTDFSAAQVMKAINQSQFFMFTKPSSGKGASNWIAPNVPAGPPVPNSSKDAEKVTAEAICPVSYHETPSVNFNVPGSTGVFNLDSGEEIKPFVNTAPADSYDKFVDSFVAYLASSAGVPFEMVLMRFNSNYTAARAALILFWRIAKIWQHEMAVDYLNPARTAWLMEEIALGRVSAPGWSDPVLRAAWLNGSWFGAPLPNTDPVKTSKSNRLDVEMGITNLDKISREQNGSDGASNRAKINREFEEIPESPWNRRVKNAS